MLNGIFGGVGTTHLHHQPLVRTDTIVLIALSALSFLIAPSFNNSSPGLSTLLKVLPFGLGLYWIFSRIFPGTGWNHPQHTPVVMQSTPVIVQPTPAPSFWSRHYWSNRNTSNSPSWWTRMWTAPATRPSQPIVHHTVVHNPPVNRTFPIVQQATAQQPPVTHVVTQAPSFVPVQRAPAQQVHPVQTSTSSFTPVYRAPAQQVHQAPPVNPTFPTVKQTPAQPYQTPPGQSGHFPSVVRAEPQGHQSTPHFNPAPSAPPLGGGSNGSSGSHLMFTAAKTRGIN